MIKANEIRVGNWFNRIESTCRVNVTGPTRWDDQEWFSVGECMDFLENYEPIPITEDWLLKFGFTRNSDGSIFWIDDVGIFSEEYTIRKYTDEYELWFGDLPASSIDIKYVHQLQNLYFALTGEELIYKADVSNHN